MKRIFALISTAIMLTMSSFNQKPIVNQECTKQSELHVFDPSVVSSNIYKDQYGANITVTYSSDWGDPNPDLSVEINLLVYEVGRGDRVIPIDPILSHYEDVNGEPTYVGEADIPGGAIIVSWVVVSSTPVF